MADLLIRGMKMPEYCYECPLHNMESGYCQFYKDSYLWSFERPARCPLVQLPAGHGRLIDADAFKADCLAATKEAKPDFIRHEDWLKSCAVTLSFCRDIDERPTIVPSEGGNGNG